MADIPWDELMDAADGSDYAPIPQGDYDLKIIETEATTSSTDKPMWKVTTAVMNGPHEGRKIWTQQTLTMDNPDALNVFFRQMAAAGLTAQFFKTKPNNQQIADALMGRTFRGKVTIREWNGVPRNNIKQWNPLGAAAAGAPPGAGSGGPPPPPAASAPPASVGPPPPAAVPEAPAASAPPAAATPPPAAAPPPAPAPPPAAPPVPEPAGVGAGGGSPDQWVVQDRPTGSSEPPPF